MSFFYPSNILNPFFNQDDYETKKNIEISQLIYKDFLDKQVQEKMKYQEENQRNKYFMKERIYKTK